MKCATMEREDINRFFDECAGADQRQRDCVGGRRRLLPGVERYRVGGQRGERPPLDPAAGPDHAAQHSRNQRPP